MEQLIEFAGNHLLLVTLFLAILALLIRNLFGGAMSGANQIDTTEAVRLMNHERGVVLDIRPEEDFKAGHVLNAVSIPENEFTERRKQLEKYKTRPLVVYCADGRASARAVAALKTLGIEQPFILKGGYLAWQDAGLPVERQQKAAGGKA